MKSHLVRWVGCGLVVALLLTACSSTVRVAAPIVEDTWQPPKGADAVTPASCEENRYLFAYDAAAPLDIREESQSQDDGFTVIHLSYGSPRGGRVPASLVVPDGRGPFAGLLLQHGMGELGG